MTMDGVMHGDPNDPAEALAIAEHFQGEWHNGGLSQLFSNWDPEDAALVPVALRVIGFPQGAEVFEKAIETMGPQTEWRDVAHRAMIDRSSDVGAYLADLDRKLSEHEKTLDAAVVRFEYELAKSSGEEMFE